MTQFGLILESWRMDVSVSSISWYGHRGGAPGSHRHTFGHNVSPTADCHEATNASRYTITPSNMVPLLLHSMTHTGLLSSHCWFGLFAIFRIGNHMTVWLLATFSRWFPRDTCCFVFAVSSVCCNMRIMLMGMVMFMSYGLPGILLCQAVQVVK